MTAAEILKYYQHVAPILTELLPNGFCIAITDREKYLMAKPGKRINLNITSGTILKEGTAVHTAIVENRRVVVRADNTLFGVPYIAYAYPIRDEAGAALGCISVAEPIDRQEGLKNMVGKLVSSIGILASSSEEISAQAQEIAAISNKSAQKVTDSMNQVKETGQVLELIKNISTQTNLLGLNAAIEAARVGEQGRTFAVVATEIRNLATTCEQSVKKVASVINVIQTGSEENYRQVINIENLIGQVAMAISEVAKEVEQVNIMTEELDRLSDDLFHT